MHNRIWPKLLLMALACFPLLPVLTAQQTAKERKPEAKAKKQQATETPGNDVFGIAKIWQFHLEITAKDWDKMQPISGKGFFGGMGGFKKPPEKSEKPKEQPTDVHVGGGFGTEFPWVPAEFTAEGKTVKNVGARFKGNASYMASSRGLKRNFRLDLDH